MLEMRCACLASILYVCLDYAYPEIDHDLARGGLGSPGGSRYALIGLARYSRPMEDFTSRRACGIDGFISRRDSGIDGLIRASWSRILCGIERDGDGNGNGDV
jgi:hypothetical protein